MNELTPIRRAGASAYEADFNAWSERQAALIRSRRFDEIDIENIAEEIESLGKSDRRALRSFCFNLILHLAKLRFAADDAPRAGWRNSADEARREIGYIIADSPSLRPALAALVLEEWQSACRKAAVQLRAHGDEGAERLADDVQPLTAEQLLDEAFVWGC